MTMGINLHPEDGVLEDYLVGNLTETESGSLEEHLLVCDACRLRLDETDAYVASMRGAAEALRTRQRRAAQASQAAQASHATRWRPNWVWFRLAPAVAALALLAGVFVWQSGPSGVAGAPFAVSLQATRGSSALPWAPADTSLRVRLDLTGLPDFPSYRLEMVSDSGAPVWRETVTAHNAMAESRMPRTKAGAYFIRVYSPAGELLREFGIRTGSR